MLFNAKSRDTNRIQLTFASQLLAQGVSKKVLIQLSHFGLTPNSSIRNFGKVYETLAEKSRVMLPHSGNIGKVNAGKGVELPEDPSIDENTNEDEKSVTKEDDEFAEWIQ
jgi:hypothetical protein